MRSENDIERLAKILRIPEKGFYYHYKHADKDGLFSYAYEVRGMALHTEIDDIHEGTMVAYRPLYAEAPAYRLGKWDYCRPVEKFNGNVDSVETSYRGPRFIRITDPKIIGQMETQRDEMYGDK